MCPLEAKYRHSMVPECLLAAGYPPALEWVHRLEAVGQSVAEASVYPLVEVEVYPLVEGSECLLAAGYPPVQEWM